MKVVLLQGHDGTPFMEHVKVQVTKVLEELDLTVDSLNLQTLPYYDTRQVSPVAALASERLMEAKGVIAMMSVHLGNMHSSMQSFFEHMMRYQEVIGDKPMLAIAYSGTQGERQAATQAILQWELLGGVDGGVCVLNQYHSEEAMLEVVERKVEAYYRILKQEKPAIRCSTYYAYHQKLPTETTAEASSMKQQLNLEPRLASPTKPSIAEILTTSQPSLDIEIPKAPDVQQEELHIDLSTKEQNIKELTQLLKLQMGSEEKPSFMDLTKVTYQRPGSTPGNRGAVKLSMIPHYFVAQHDKQFEAVIRYTLIDLKEEGLIQIKEGDCNYLQETSLPVTVEIALTQDVLEQLFKKQLTYQKAFMIGKLKVKGNFGILSKLDQSFKSI